MTDDEELDLREDEDEKKGKKEKKPKKEDKKGAKEDNDDEDEEGGTLSVILVTVFIVIVWLAILLLLIKLDVGGFGSGVLEPVLKDVPYVSKILPGHSLTASGNGVIEDDSDPYAGYDNLDDAIARIKTLENQLAEAQAASNDTDQTIADLQAEVARLKTYEQNQVEFEKIKDEFYNEVVFGDSALDISEYQKYYETIDPTNAEILYKQVVQQEQVNKEIEDYAEAYSSMKAKDAAEIFDTMTDRLTLVAKILGAMGTEDRGDILAQMDPDVAAQVTKLMEPTSSGTSASTATSSSSASSSASESSDSDDSEVSDNSAD